MRKPQGKTTKRVHKTTDEKMKYFSMGYRHGRNAIKAITGENATMIDYLEYSKTCLWDSGEWNISTDTRGNIKELATITATGKIVTIDATSGTIKTA